MKRKVVFDMLTSHWYTTEKGQKRGRRRYLKKHPEKAGFHLFPEGFTIKRRK